MTDMNEMERQQMDLVKQAFADIIAYFTKQDSSATDATRLQKYDIAKEVVLAHASTSVLFLTDQFENNSFLQKETAYDLLIALGQGALERIKLLVGQKDPISKIWLISVLHFYHDFALASVFEEFLSSSEPYVRYLAALALVFQGLVARAKPDLLMEVLIQALMSDEHIEGNAFYIADSALSCITLLTGMRFTEVQKEKVEFYNFNSYLFPPPAHPFPYTSDKIVTLSLQARQLIASNIESWWQKNRGSFQLKEVTSCFDY